MMKSEKTLNWLWAATLLYMPLALFEPPIDNVFVSAAFLIHLSLIVAVTGFNFVVGFKEFMDSIEKLNSPH